MGKSYDFHCNYCFYHHCISQGIGMYMPKSSLTESSGRKSRLEELVKNEQIWKQTQYLLDEKKAQIADGYSYELYVCNHCNNIYDKFYYRLEYNEGMYEPEYKCSKCMHPLKRLEINNSSETWSITDLQDNPVNLQCPKCVEGILYIEDYMLWD